jgi:hypothetical protein
MCVCTVLYDYYHVRIYVVYYVRTVAQGMARLRGDCEELDEDIQCAIFRAPLLSSKTLE